MLGAILSIAIKWIGALFLMNELNKMVFFAEPEYSQITVHGTKNELTSIYGEDQLGNTSFAIQVKHLDGANEENLSSEDLMAHLEVEQQKYLKYVYIRQSV
jgi:hypothetical protein